MAGIDVTEQLRNATKGLQAVADDVALTAYRLMLEERWIVPPSHRPACPLDQQPCKSWTCLVDVCVDAKKEQANRGLVMAERNSPRYVVLRWDTNWYVAEQDNDKSKVLPYFLHAQEAGEAVRLIDTQEGA